MSISPYRKNFILKGGLLFFSLPVPVRRPTVDIDFLGIRVADDPEKVRTIFAEIARTACRDGMEFYPEEISIHRIKEGTDFSGSRVFLPSVLAKARVKLQVDVAFGDAFTKEPRVFDFPALLDLPKPHIFAYSMETMIAEKFQAIVERQTATSRMKDFFDIASLSDMMSFEGNELYEAFTQTFDRRSADKSGSGSVFSDEFASNPGLAGLWKGFLARERIISPDDFAMIMKKIRGFLEPVVTGACRNRKWDHTGGTWSVPKKE